MLRYYDLLAILGDPPWRPFPLTSEHSIMHDDPKHPLKMRIIQPLMQPLNSLKSGGNEHNHFLSYEHLARETTLPAAHTESPKTAARISEHSSENELGDGSETPEQKWPEHNPSPDRPPGAGKLLA